jgi:hypothetical protein
MAWTTVDISKDDGNVIWSTFARCFVETDEAIVEVRAYDGSLFSSPVELKYRVKAPSGEPPDRFLLEVLYPVKGLTVPPDFSVQGVVKGMEPDACFICFGYDYQDPIVIPGAAEWSHEIRGMAPGQYVMHVVARNATWYSNWVSFNFYVDEDASPPNSPPQVGIDSPQDGATVKGEVVVKGWSTDDTGTEYVQVRVNGGPWSNASGTDEWSFRLDTSSMETGWVEVEARANDGVLDSATMETRYWYKPTVETDNGSPSALIILVLLILITAVIVIEYRRYSILKKE